MHQVLFAEEVAALLGLSTEQVHPFSVEDQEKLYTQAYQLYEVGDYATAASFFTKLAMCNPFLEKNWRGLASCRQMQQEYAAALRAWSLVALLADKDPLPHFHAAECLISLNETREAFKALHAAEALAINNKALYEKIALLKQVHAHAT